MDLRPSPDRIAVANQVFIDALELPASERGEFVLRKCAGDETLCNSVLRLLSNYGRLGDFLEVPAAQRLGVAPLELQPGEILAKRFRILRLLGRGGIGEVYSAEDTQLGETVALKTLRPGVREDDFFSGRFREELRLARKIGHRNVCRIFDLFSDVRDGVEIWFFSMEYIEGVTLAERLKAGSLDADDALGMLRQIAAGLDAAHALGIVHRDLKPANVMLAGDRVVITDFGLAKVLDDAAPRNGETQTGQIVGTPEYMAPEQLLGAEITPATDVYALGLILFEMLAGRRPYPSESIVRSAVRRALEPPPSIRQLVPSAPAHWDGSIRAALENNPAQRPQSAAALVSRLEGFGPQRRFRWSRVSRRTLLYGAGAAAVSGIVAALRLSDRGPLIGASEKSLTVMLTPFAQPAGMNGDVRGDTLTLLLAKLLGQSSRLQVLPAADVASGWELVRSHRDEPMPASLPPGTARHIALLKGASIVLFGGVSQVGDEWSLAVRLELVEGSPDAAKAWRDASFRDANAATAVMAASNWIRRSLAEPEMQMQVRNRRPEELTTRNWHALQQFAESRRSSAAGDTAAAVEHLREALDTDPDFAMASARLGDILTGLGRPDEGLPYYERAEKVLLERGLTDRESLQIRGNFALDTGRFETAEHVWSLFLQQFPGDSAAMQHRATALDLMGRQEEAEKVLDAAIARDPKSYLLLFRRAHLLLDEGRLDDVQRDCDRAAAISDKDWTDQLRSSLAYGRLDFPAAMTHVERLRTAGTSRFQSKWFAFRASYLVDQGDMAGAERTLRDGLAFDLRTGLTAEAAIRKRCQLAELLIQRGRLAEARGECRSALASAPGIETTLRIAGVLARAGDASAAAYIPKVEPKYPTQLHWLTRLRGELGLARGDAKQAVRLMNGPSAGHNSGEFPAYLLRAANAAGNAELVDRCLESLFTNPGRYWFQTGTSELGFVRLALTIAQARRYSATQPKAAKAQRALDNFYLRRS